MTTFYFYENLMMRNLYLLLVCFSICFYSCNTPKNETSLKTFEDSLSYYQGVYSGWKLRENGYKDFNFSSFEDGIQSVSNTDLFDYQKMNESGIKIQDKLEDGVIDYFDRNKHREGVYTTKSDLQYEILRKGIVSNLKPTVGDSLILSYKGIRIDGLIFEEFAKDTFYFSGKLPGLREGISLMNKGSKFRFFLPPKLGIWANLQMAPPNSYKYMSSIFEIELYDILPKTITKDTLNTKKNEK